MFYRIFNEEFYIVFYQTKKDQCQDCVVYNNATGGDKKPLKPKYEDHLNEKVLSKIGKVKDQKEVEHKDSTCNENLTWDTNLPECLPN